MSEPAVSIDETTFLIWRRYCDDIWHIGNIVFPDTDYPDGSEDLLSILDTTPQTYQKWAMEYYEKQVPIDIAQLIYNHTPIDQSLLSRLKKLTTRLRSTYIKEEASIIGYPVSL